MSVLSMSTPSLNPPSANILTLSHQWQGARLGLLLEWADGSPLTIQPHYWASLCQKAGARYVIFSPSLMEALSEEESTYLTNVLNACIQQNYLTGVSISQTSIPHMPHWEDIGVLRIAWTPPHASQNFSYEAGETLLCNQRQQGKPNFVTFKRDFGEWLAPEAWETLDWLVLDPHTPLRSPMRSLRTLINLLVRAAVRGGNLLLSVPVSAHGVEARHQRRLEQLGNWLNLYGHTLYDTQPGPYPPQLWGGCTWQENRLYVHVLDWVDEEVILPLPSGHIRKITCLTAPSIGIQRTANSLSFRIPPENQQEMDTIIEIELDQPWA